MTKNNIGKISIEELKSYNAQICSALKNCYAYQKKFPDEIAAERVNANESLPHPVGKYYVNLTLENPILIKSNSIEDRQEFKKERLDLILGEDVYENGVIIEISLINENDIKSNYAIDLKNYSYVEMMDTLISYSTDERYYLAILNSDEDFEKDIKILSSQSKAKTIVYAIASFSMSKLNSLIGEKYADWTCIDFSINDFSKTTIALPGKITSTEQNAINWLESHNADSTPFKKVTQYSLKNNVLNATMQNEFAFCDMVGFMFNRVRSMKNCNEVEKSENTIDKICCNSLTIPNEVEICTRFVQYSSHNVLSCASASLEYAKSQYDNVIRAVIDTIPTDPWEDLIISLKKQYDKTKMLLSLEKVTNMEESNDQIYEKIIDRTENLCSKEFIDRPLAFISQPIIGDTGKSLSYLEIFNQIKDVIDMEYEKICDLDTWKMRDHIINQFSKDDFIKFKNEYSDDMISKSAIFTKNVPVYMISGRIFYPTGLDVYALTQDEMTLLNGKSIANVFDSLHYENAKKPNDSMSLISKYCNDIDSYNEKLGDGHTSEFKNIDENGISDMSYASNVVDELTKNWANDITIGNLLLNAYFSNKNMLNWLMSLTDNIAKYIIYPLGDDIAYVPSVGSPDRFLIYRVEKVKCGCPDCDGNGYCGLKGKMICRNNITYIFDKKDRLTEQCLYHIHSYASDKINNVKNTIEHINDQVSNIDSSLSISIDSMTSYMKNIVYLKSIIEKYFDTILKSCNISSTRLNRQICKFINTVLNDMLVKFVIDTDIKKMKFSDFVHLDMQTYLDKLFAAAIRSIDASDETYCAIREMMTSRARFILPDAKRFSDYVDANGNVKYETIIDTVNKDIEEWLSDLKLETILIGNCKKYGLDENAIELIVDNFNEHNEDNIQKILKEKYPDISYDNLLVMDSNDEHSTLIMNTWNVLYKMIEDILHTKNSFSDFSIFDKTTKILTYIENADENMISTESSSMINIAKTIYRNAMKIDSSAKKRLS